MKKNRTIEITLSCLKAGKTLCSRIPRSAPMFQMIAHVESVLAKRGHFGLALPDGRVLFPSFYGPGRHEIGAWKNT